MGSFGEHGSRDDGIGDKHVGLGVDGYSKIAECQADVNDWSIAVLAATNSEPKVAVFTVISYSSNELELH